MQAVKLNGFNFHERTLEIIERAAADPAATAAPGAPPPPAAASAPRGSERIVRLFDEQTMVGRTLCFEHAVTVRLPAAALRPDNHPFHTSSAVMSSLGGFRSSAARHAYRAAVMEHLALKIRDREMWAPMDPRAATPPIGSPPRVITYVARVTKDRMRSTLSPSVIEARSAREARRGARAASHRLRSRPRAFPLPVALRRCEWPSRRTGTRCSRRRLT